MKLYNFPEIFGEYISTEKYRSMLKNTLFTDLHINKDAMSMTALLHVDAFENIMCLKAVANEVKSSLQLKSVEFEYVLPPEALKAECFPMLLKVVRKHVPQTNGFLDDIETSFIGDVFTINFLKHGRDICENAGADFIFNPSVEEMYIDIIEPDMYPDADTPCPRQILPHRWNYARP